MFVQVVQQVIANSMLFIVSSSGFKGFIYL